MKSKTIEYLLYILSIILVLPIFVYLGIRFNSSLMFATGLLAVTISMITIWSVFQITNAEW